MLSTVNAFMQGFRRILVVNANCLLPNDGTRIDAGINEMHRATGYLDTILKCLFPRFEPGKRRSNAS